MGENNSGVNESSIGESRLSKFLQRFRRGNKEQVAQTVERSLPEGLFIVNPDTKLRNSKPPLVDQDEQLVSLAGDANQLSEFISACQENPLREVNRVSRVFNDLGAEVPLRRTGIEVVLPHKPYKDREYLNTDNPSPTNERVRVEVVGARNTGNALIVYLMRPGEYSSTIGPTSEAEFRRPQGERRNLDMLLENRDMPQSFTDMVEDSVARGALVSYGFMSRHDYIGGGDYSSDHTKDNLIVEERRPLADQVISTYPLSGPIPVKFNLSDETKIKDVFSKVVVPGNIKVPTKG